MGHEKDLQYEQLLAAGQIEERPFESTVPIIGPIIAAVRNFWNSVAAKWTYRQLVEQQNTFNAQIVQRLFDLESQVVGQMVEQDREQTHLLRETAELLTALSQLSRLLLEMEERLIRLENSIDEEE